jgi:hypothetical protein
MFMGAVAAFVSFKKMLPFSFTEGVDWTHLAQDRVQWRAVVNTVMKLLVP